MKTFILLLGLLLSTAATARSLHPDTFARDCDQELNVLEQVSGLTPEGFKELALEISETATECKVKHYRPASIALCGAPSVHKLIFTFKTAKYGQVELTVDHSQLQCLEIYRLPTIEKIVLQAK